MAKLEKSEALGRIIRQDNKEDLTIPTWALVREAIRAGRIEEGLTLFDYGCGEAKRSHDSMCAFADDLITHLASFGEEEIYKVVVKRYEPMIRHWLSHTPGLKESIERCTEFQRGHGGINTITEEWDRYVIKCDPCGSGGQLRRNREVAVTKKAYHWTWGRSGVPYYCIHCCVMFEIIPTDLRGYPIRITLIGDRPEDPCTHLYYKKPELIPEEYYTRIGHGEAFESIRGKGRNLLRAGKNADK
jgi:hypothetical protein